MVPLVSCLTIYPKSEARWVIYLGAQGGDDGFVAKVSDVPPPAGLCCRVIAAQGNLQEKAPRRMQKHQEGLLPSENVQSS